MGYLSKRRGVISVFLLMIFMVTYVFMGMLVDAGRYRMAQTYMESALDSASNSVLSNYNKLVFDLYGLFSVDTKLEEGQTLEDAIYEKYNHYLQETLSMVDATKYETMLAELVKGDNTKAVMNTASLYDFEVTRLDAGTSITLADPANVENQIIEYMKFRAPVSLTEEMKGFLGKMNTIVEMKERVEEALKKEKIKDKYESDKDGNIPLSTQAANLLKDINVFAGTLYNYTVTPHKEYSELQAAGAPESSMVSEYNPYNVKDYIKDFDAALNRAETNYIKKINLEKEKYADNLYDLLYSLRDAMIEEIENQEEQEDGKTAFVEITLSRSYVKESDSDSQTDIFTEIKLPTQLEGDDGLEELAAEVFDKVFEKTDAWCTEYASEYGKEENRHAGVLSEAVENYKTALNNAKTALDSNLSRMESNAATLYNEARNLVSRIQTTVTRYESYTAELKVAKGEDGDVNKETVYATEIELAEANMGELLKNLDLLANSRAYLDDLGFGIKDSSENRMLLSDDLVNVAGTIINKWIDKPGEDIPATPLATMAKGNDRYTDASASVTLYKEKYAVASIPFITESADIVKQILPEIQHHICVLYSHVSYFHSGHYRQDVDVIVGEEEKLWEEKVDSEANKNAVEEKATVENTVTTAEGTKISLDSDKVKKKTEMLKVEYSYTSAKDETEITAETSVNEEVTAGTLTKILECGLELIKELGGLLETARDNLYVDAYVMSMFPNYKDHYKGYETSKNSSLLSGDRGKYVASYAEVEFIITGAGADGKTAVADKVFAEGADGFGNMSVWSMRTRLFGTRMLFNSLSMLTDSAKLQQASVLSAWAGPFAPLVSAVLVICWIIAETVIDVMVLMGDITLENHAPNGEIPIFKQSGDWLFSLNGVAGELAGLAVDTLADKVLEKANELTESAEQKANVMIYKAYSAVNSGISEVDSAIDDAVATGQEQLTQWSNELSNNINKAIKDTGTVPSGVQSQLSGMTNNLNSIPAELGSVAEEEKDKLVEAAQSVTNDAKEQVVLAVSRMSDTVMEKTKSYVNNTAASAKDFIGKNIEKVIPTGTVVNSGNATVKMDYHDYLYFFLFIMNQETKVKRIQAVIQANLQVGGLDTFQMKNAPVAVWADLECSMKYMFMSNGIVPESMKKDGRLRLKVISAQSY